ncbi:MAG: Rossmann-like and DUF2520 domain-containing protein [Microthrixaceae bacterium]
MSTDRVRIIGAGRSGGSFALALGQAGWKVDLVTHQQFDADETATGVRRVTAAEFDLVLICVPDSDVAIVAAALTVDEAVVVAHCAGSLGLEVLGSAVRSGSVHPLVALADAELGAAALQGAWFALSGDPFVTRVATALRGRTIKVAEEDRVSYHAAAVLASNHLVALLAQVESIADELELPLEAFLSLSRVTLNNVSELGPAAALTGPVARGDWSTVLRHLQQLPQQERQPYLALALRAAQLVDSLPSAAELSQLHQEVAAPDT